MADSLQDVYVSGFSEATWESPLDGHSLRSFLVWPGSKRSTEWRSGQRQRSSVGRRLALLPMGRQRTCSAKVKGSLRNALPFNL